MVAMPCHCIGAQGAWQPPPPLAMQTLGRLGVQWDRRTRAMRVPRDLYGSLLSVSEEGSTWHQAAVGALQAEGPRRMLHRHACRLAGAAWHSHALLSLACALFGPSSVVMASFSSHSLNM